MLQCPCGIIAAILRIVRYLPMEVVVATRTASRPESSAEKLVGLVLRYDQIKRTHNDHVDSQLLESKVGK